MTPIKLVSAALLLTAFSAGACNYDISNPNSPDVIGPNPSAAQVGAAVNGILVATRQDVADWALDGAIFGREAYRIDPADPRFVQEMMQGPLDPGSRAFGGDHWLEPYSAIRSANDLLAVIGTASALSAEQQSAVTGFAHTLQAYNFMIVLSSHTQDQIPIDVGTDASAPPASFATNAQAWDHVIALLDQAATELVGTAFPFTLPAGFTGFNTPPTFLQFNRALRARVAVYRGDFAGALTFLGQSFLNTALPLSTGVYMDFGTGPGDVANPLAVSDQTSENFGHPTLRTQAQLQPGGALDQRFLSKLVTRPSRSGGTTNTTPVQQISSDLGWIRYPSPSTPIPLIKNEELILLRAEANLGLLNPAAAVTDIDLVRTTSGGLPVYGGTVDQASVLAELLYNKRYSLMYEGAHSWIDYRRYGLTAALQSIDRVGPPPDVIFPTLPIPTAELQPRT
ncbi:MAG TPA: RagB/SusD family nutrient uptake outer membrane protein [Gemmatimonadales bacterium]|nr:RagB/SusD family nutrient uptake outer membrane protein [Gemmatimonadales bacterium]